MEKDPYKDIINQNFKKEVPSFDFTKKVMGKIEANIENKKVFQPLIPQKWMIVICCIYILIFVFPLLIYAKELTFSFLNNIEFQNFNLITFKDSLTLIFRLLFVFGTLFIGEKLISFNKSWT